MNRQGRANKSRGLTLIEMVMAIAIVGILVGAAALYTKEVIDLWNFLSFRNEIISGGRLALTRMTREIRQIKNETAILIADINQFQFIDTNDRTIDFFLNATELLRNSNILASGVRNLTFNYFNITNNEIPAPVDSYNRTQIYRITISLDMSSGNQNRTIKTQVYPRNL